ncbi:MAG: class I SAM-dependent DNA methyltransferase [Acidimicrobiia bacterium]
MKGYSRETYGAEWASDYDAISPEPPEAMIDALADLGQGGRVLELAIGTGRVALPLHSRGVDVSGIDISEQMVAKLRAKPGGEQIRVMVGDFAEVAVEGSFRLIYLVFNTLFALLDQEEQIRCFANVAERLQPGGRFVIEAFVPDLARFDRGQRVQITSSQTDRLTLEASRHHPDTQRVDSHHIRITAAGMKILPVAIRYAWPAEIDLMARLAGLDLESRWGGWDRSGFGPDAKLHVSIYRRPD